MTREERAHLARVADLGCIICEGPAECHHIRLGQGRKRASHFEVIPLCPAHHRTGGFGVAYHAGAKTWQQRYGAEADLLAETLRRLDAPPLL